MSQVRVLVVDDQELYRRAMAAVVEATDGFVVVGEASTGEESVELAGALRPDLVLMDVNLPGIGGLEATRRLLAADATPAPVVVLLSTYDEDDVDVAGCGAAAYITKSAFGSAGLTAAWEPACAAR